MTVMTWVADAEALFGPEWVGKLSLVANVAPRSIREYWMSDGAPPKVVAWLDERVKLLPESARRPYGAILLCVWREETDRGRQAVETALALAIRDISERRLP